jgi:hypothetical protein
VKQRLRGRLPHKLNLCRRTSSTRCRPPELISSCRVVCCTALLPTKLVQLLIVRYPEHGIVLSIGCACHAVSVHASCCTDSLLLTWTGTPRPSWLVHPMLEEIKLCGAAYLLLLCPCRSSSRGCSAIPTQPEAISAHMSVRPLLLKAIMACRHLQYCATAVESSGVQGRTITSAMTVFEALCLSNTVKPGQASEQTSSECMSMHLAACTVVYQLHLQTSCNSKHCGIHSRVA